MLFRFEWDPAKAAGNLHKQAGNLHKHGVSLETAVRVFADPFAFTGLDRIEGGEHRWQTLGAVEGYVVVLVAHTVHYETEDGQSIETIRIISARAADRKERRRYEQESR